MIAGILIFVCVIVCIVIYKFSNDNMKNNIVDNGAQLVVTVGVIFTFVGVAIGLWNFDTNSDKMADNINLFLEGMKTAFWTSIIGMIFGIIIKWQQGKIEQADDNFTKKILTDIKESIDAGNNVDLSKEITNLVGAMNNFVTASNSSRADMKDLSENMKRQVETVNNLSTALTNNIESLSEKIVDSNKKQAAEFKKTMEDFSQSQSARLDKMLELTEQARKNSENLLTETKNYQQQSLANDKILSDNTAQISAMKKSFDDFLDTMATNYSQALIDALNKSIGELNTQLQTQFGDNFKELNQAVFKVVEWQENYKITVEQTTGELKELNDAFKTFSEKIAAQVDKHIKSMTENLEIFADTSDQNVAVQKNLNEAVISISQAVQAAKDSVTQMQNITQSFGGFSNEVIKQNNAAIENYKNTVAGNLNTVAQNNKEFADEIKKLRNEAFTVKTDTSQYVKEFGEASSKAMTEIRTTIEKFNTALDTESLKAVQTLAASLSQISTQMIGNYNALIDRIQKLDKFLRREGK